MRAEMRRAAAIDAANRGNRVLMLYNSWGQLKWEFPLMADASAAFSNKRIVSQSNHVIDFPGGGALIFRVMEPRNPNPARGVQGMFSLQDGSLPPDPEWQAALTRLEEVRHEGE